MATLGQTIFWSMIVIIVVLVGVIALIIGFGISGNSSNTVKASISVARLAETGVLQCTFTPDIKQNNVILWEKEGVTGVVHLYDKGNDVLKDQNAIFKGRTAMFQTQVGTGNASLKLSDVKNSDAGTYKCTVTTSAGKADSKMELRVGLYSPVDAISPSNRSLLCTSERWDPQPTVNWFNKTSGANITMDSVYTPSQGLGGAWLVSSELKITPETQYTCVIENSLARGTVDVMLKESGLLLKDSKLQILSAAPGLLHHTRLQSLLLPVLAYIVILL